MRRVVLVALVLVSLSACAGAAATSTATATPPVAPASVPTAAGVPTLPATTTASGVATPASPGTAPPTAIATPAGKVGWSTGYYPGWQQPGYPPSAIPWASLTHLVHFSLLTGAIPDHGAANTAALREPEA